MGQITLNDIRNRINNLKSINETNAHMNESLLKSSHSIAKNSKPEEICRFMESMASGKNFVPFEAYLELFESVAIDGNPSQVDKAVSVITGKILPKVRDAKSTSSLLKGRLTRLQNKLKPKNAITVDVPDTTAPQTDTSDVISASENAMLEALDKWISCDRIIDNYNSISKRFNLESLFSDKAVTNGVYETVIELCKMIDTYDIPNSVKCNTVIESAWYGLESNFINYDKNDVQRAVVDYFSFKENWLNECMDIINNNVVIPMNISLNETAYKDFYSIFNEFKKSPELVGGVDSLMYMVSELFNPSVNGIVDGTIYFLDWIRLFFAISSDAVSIDELSDVISSMIDKILALYLGKDETEYIIKSFDDEISKSKSMMDNLHTDEEKSKLNKFISYLLNAKGRLENYYSIFSSCTVSDDKIKQALGSIPQDGITEASLLKKLEEMLVEFSEFSEDHVITESMIHDLPRLLSGEDLSNVSKAIAKFPTVFYSESYIDGIKENLSEINEEAKDKNSMSYIIKRSELKNALNIMKTTDEYQYPVTPYQSIFFVESVDDIYRSIYSIYTNESSDNYMLEASISNALKTASMRLRNAMQKLSDKDKAVSRSIDVSVNNLKKSIENAFTTDNREAVIKGSILPSASKVIKLAIVNGALAIFVHPALAVIGILGYLGVSKHFKAKERQMLIDELDIELKMCQKYIDLAESKNDMKALKQLLMIQRDLERQKQRIKYNMKIQLGQKVYDVKSADGR